MRNKEKDKKAREASNKAILASVTEEMAQPRMAESARKKLIRRRMQEMDSVYSARFLR